MTQSPSFLAEELYTSCVVKEVVQEVEGSRAQGQKLHACGKTAANNDEMMKLYTLPVSRGSGARGSSPDSAGTEMFLPEDEEEEEEGDPEKKTSFKQ